MGSGILLPEGNGAGFCIHGIHDGKGLHMVAQVPDDPAADLEALLNDNAAAFHNGTGILGNGNQTLQGAAVGQEVIDDQNVLPFVEEFLGNDDLVLVLVGAQSIQSMEVAPGSFSLFT